MEFGCFAYDGAKRCKVLKNKLGCGPHCSFRQTQAAYDAARRRAERRLARLPEMLQQQIAETYYNGASPWLITTRKAVG